MYVIKWSLAIAARFEKDHLADTPFFTIFKSKSAINELHIYILTVFSESPRKHLSG